MVLQYGLHDRHTVWACNQIILFRFATGSVRNGEQLGRTFTYGGKRKLRAALVGICKNDLLHLVPMANRCVENGIQTVWVREQNKNGLYADVVRHVLEFEGRTRDQETAAQPCMEMEGLKSAILCTRGNAPKCTVLTSGNQTFDCMRLRMLFS